LPLAFPASNVMRSNCGLVNSIRIRLEERLLQGRFVIFYYVKVVKRKIPPEGGAT